MKSRNYAGISLLASLAACNSATAETVQKNSTQAPQKPNVIVILADDLGYGDLKCYGAKNVETPHVDKLASEGIRFTNAHTVAATSTPSRYSLLTGEYAWRRPDTDIAALGDLGFDYHYIMAATADRVPCVFIENGKVANYDPSDPIEVSYTKNFPGEPTGKDNPELLYNLHPSNGHDMSIVNGISRIGFMKGGGKALWKDENIADSITVHAIDFIKQHKDEPFFMYFATNDVHVPRFPHDRFRGKNPMGLRGDAIAQFDWTVGQLMETLDQLGLTENTLIILSSDNGPVVDDGYKDKAEELLNGHTPSGPWRGNKYSAFEGGTAVPVIVRWPQKIKKTGDSDVLMSQIDWLASLGALINARLPKGSAPDSYDRLGNLIGTDKTDRPWIVEQSMNHTLSVRTKDWKYIEPNDDPTTFMKAEKIETGNLNVPQLYEMEKVSEQENVAEKYPETVFELQTILRQVRNKRIKM